MRGFIRPILLTTLFILIIGTLSACGVIGGSAKFGDDINALFPKGTEGFVVCSDTCREQAQCGITTLKDAEEKSTDVNVVLVNLAGPATRKHSAFIQADQAIIVRDSRIVRMIVDSSKEPYQMSFYRVFYAQTNSESWVHGACVSTRALK